MYELLSYMRELNAVSLFFRLALAMISGGLLGLERERKRRPAGCRTYMLVCLGAALTMLLGQYESIALDLHWSSLAESIGQHTDVSRFSAQVVAGIGFLGAGTILVTGRQEVKGLTTAAGLWASACMGLAIGAGFYEGGICATVLVAEIIFSRIEYRILEHVPEINLYMEYSDKTCLERVLQLFRHHNLTIMDIEITRASGSESHNACAIFSLRLHRKCPINTLLNGVSATEGVITVAEL